MTPNQYHEKESVILRGTVRRSRGDLARYLRGLGFQAIDDFYTYPRPGRLPKWQSLDLLSVDVLIQGKAVYETEDDVADGVATEWDSLRCDYLLATLPRECIVRAVALVGEICGSWQLELTYAESAVDSSELLARWNEIASNLASKYAPPGSEELAILIASSYPRR